MITEEIGLELSKTFLAGGVLNCACKTHPGIANHSVQTAFARDHFGDASRNGCVVIDIHCDEWEPPAGLLRPPRGAVDLVALFHQVLRDSPAKAGARSGDQHDARFG